MEKAVYRHIRKLEKKLKKLEKKGGGHTMEDLKIALKEGLRVAVLAVIPVAIDGVGKGQVDFKLLGSVALVAVLRFVDSWLHETGKAEKGLTRF